MQSPEPITHIFEIERKINAQGFNTAFMMGYHYAQALFSPENMPHVIHMEGLHNNGKSSFAKGMAVACTGEKYADESNPLRGHFNWHSGVTEQNVTIFDASKIIHPESKAVFQPVDSFILDGKQTLIVEHPSFLTEDSFIDERIKSQVRNPDVTIHIGDSNDARRQTVRIEIKNPENVKPDGFQSFQQQFLPKMPWCQPVKSGL